MCHRATPRTYRIITVSLGEVPYAYPWMGVSHTRTWHSWLHRWSSLIADAAACTTQCLSVCTADPVPSVAAHHPQPNPCAVPIEIFPPLLSPFIRGAARSAAELSCSGVVACDAAHPIAPVRAGRGGDQRSSQLVANTAPPKFRPAVGLVGIQRLASFPLFARQSADGGHLWGNGCRSPDA